MRFNNFETQTSDKAEIGDSSTGTSTSTTYFTKPTYSAEKGWECPRCGRINAPWVRQCDCSGNWNLTWDWWNHPHEDWWKRVKCDSDTFKIHPESSPVYTTTTPGTVDSATTATIAKSHPNEKIEVWSSVTGQCGGSDYWDEEKKCYTNDPSISNCATAANSPWNQFSTLTAQVNKLKYEIEEIKETK